MTEEEKKAIEFFNADVEYLEEGLKNPNYIGRFITIQDKEVEYLKIVLNLIEKQEKVMDYMVDRIEWLMKSNGIMLDFEHKDNFTKEDIKEYFYRKVEENE